MSVKTHEFLLLASSGAFKGAFSYTLSSEMAGHSKCQRWSKAARINVVEGLLSYIPIVNLIALSIFLAKRDKSFYSTPIGKAILTRSILCMTGILVPLVILLDTTGTIMKSITVCIRRRMAIPPGLMNLEESVRRFKTTRHVGEARELKRHLNRFLAVPDVQARRGIPQIENWINLIQTEVDGVIKEFEKKEKKQAEEAKKNSLIL